MAVNSRRFYSGLHIFLISPFVYSIYFIIFIFFPRVCMCLCVCLCRVVSFVRQSWMRRGKVHNQLRILFSLYVNVASMPRETSCRHEKKTFSVNNVRSRRGKERCARAN